MKYYLNILIFIILISCSDNNNVSKIPTISFENIVFKKSENNFVQDSLILTINFIDGDGDLGLSNDENSYPYHQYNAIIDENFNWITYGTEDVGPLFIFMNQTDQLLFIVKMITEHHLIATTILLILLTQFIKWILFISKKT